MIDKNIGFNRTVKLDWLNAIASYVYETEDQVEIRSRLEAIMLDVMGSEAKRKNIDILVNIWLKNRECVPGLYAEAKDLFQDIFNPTDRIWLHYGLILAYYPYFREVAKLVGQISRYEDQFTKSTVREMLVSSYGELGSLERTLRHILSSMKDWEVLSEGLKRSIYITNRRTFSTSNSQLEAWLLACALHSHPASQIAFDDLLRLPELFPFNFKVNVDILRKNERFSFHRQGAGLIMVEINE